ncbi:type II toxin-antitoxin system VapC family toxin [Streptomonospora salina]|uniref:Putative nucleic acid-binding protein n=1 Tax=Streptomonospora salina TaxID=104205 RepID=A0A841E244_9ACTN|nr:PIN domain-containing protein [Streptomonospora salina]MBB5997106.1 putative nucleic acid-binding protein [Streptomonospora salina]
MIVIADTSGIIAASDRNAPEAPACRAVLEKAGTVIVSGLVLAELDHTAKARFGPAARSRLLDHLLAQAHRMRFQVPETSVDVLDTARAVQRRYADLDLDLAAGVNVALAAEYRTDALLSLDRRDFRTVRPLTPHQAFRLLPDDLA